MGKKKSSKVNPDHIKESGNRLFAQGKYQEALKMYSQALEIQSHHVYFSNRGNCHL